MITKSLGYKVAHGHLAVFFLLILTSLWLVSATPARPPAGRPPGRAALAPKAISPDLFGVFFEDLSYAADGGLYAELVQNRSFEYSPSDRSDWNSLTAWHFFKENYTVGTLAVETSAPLNAHNPHYAVLKAAPTGRGAVGLRNEGFDGIPVKAGDVYNFSVFAKPLRSPAMQLVAQLRTPKGVVLAERTVPLQASGWHRYTATLRPTATADTASLVVMVRTPGTVALDNTSLFPQKTFKNRPNGLRADLAQTIADLHPKFVRFPGGCVAHGDWLDNLYRWQNTIGPVEARREQRNLWNYHQTAGLGYFEYFQFCEDIGAKPLPVVAAGVCCQKAGGSWRIGSIGQQGIPLLEMPAYIQEVLDLVEYANGPVTSVWGAKRAAAGHPAPFNLEYLGLGNEDKQTPVFRERFAAIYKAVKQKYPQLKVIGTVGPEPAGSDFDLGWTFARQLALPLVDEHYYKKPSWFLANGQRYDTYDRTKPGVYVGEYASWGNTLFNALAEAAYMTSLERNGDVVRLASYAPLLARVGHVSWNPNLIYFTGTQVCRTPNYYVQQLFSTNQGTHYLPGIVTALASDTAAHLAASCVRAAGSRDLILKLVNPGAAPGKFSIDLTSLGVPTTTAALHLLRGEPTATNTLGQPETVAPTRGEVAISPTFTYDAPAYSLSVLRISGSAGR